MRIEVDSTRLRTNRGNLARVTIGDEVTFKATLDPLTRKPVPTIKVGIINSIAVQRGQVEQTFLHIEEKDQRSESRYVWAHAADCWAVID